MFAPADRRCPSGNSKPIQQTVDNVDALAIHVPTSALVMDQIFSHEIAKAPVAGLDDYKA